VEKTVTPPRIKAIYKQWRKTPPLAAMVAQWVGYKAPSLEGEKAPRKAENAASTDEFIDFLRQVAPSGNITVN